MLRHINTWPLLLTLVAAAALISCSSDESQDTAGASATRESTPVVFVVNYPLRYFAERIGAEDVAVEFPAPADEDPAYWSPSAEQIAAYQQADLILLNGAGYAKWVPYASLPPSKLVDTSQAFRDKLIPMAESLTHSHGPTGQHAHGDMAFTTWLDPTLAIEQARAVKDAFAAAWPDKADAFEQRFNALATDLRQLDNDLRDALSGTTDQPLIASHPVYQYLTRRYDLNVRSLHWEPDEAPTDAMWRELKALVADHPARWMIWEDTPDEQTVRALMGLDVTSVVFSPCANADGAGDYLSLMHENLRRCRLAFSQ
ncbi:MAG: metal ABC transporter substrate-binding protein [Planctomycetota bacterium]|jgi:zinc transport system substrate-binding protein